MFVAEPAKRPAATKSKPAPGQSEGRSRGQGARIVYDALRHAILNLDLKPGAPVDEVSLAGQFQMSRSPIREALVRLASDGLVTTLPNRNTIVSVIDFVGLPVYFEALALMYRVTTRSAAVHRTEEHMVAVRSHQAAFAAAVKRRDAIAMITSNRDFHVAIAEAGGNQYFTAFFTRLLDEGRRILRLYYQSFGDKLPKQYVAEHDSIVSAIDAGDADLADRLAAAHAAQIVQQIRSYIGRETAAHVELETLGR
ncbi:MAG: GntR family transcriptional regulator [Devosia nanyangense]|uniref:GntR family transcriptional regulator n=1 Tax=Devosia nanyangense TaxID=1228055 RepID=A0A933L2F1_9HYPH|nr:GntR family transcriptional regulator [Devosia nanyangense]